MQTSPLNRLVYFCWAVGGNMCLTSVSVASCFAAGFHCPLIATPLRLVVDNRCIQRAALITVQSMSSRLTTAPSVEVKWFLNPTLCLDLKVSELLFMQTLWKVLRIDISKVNTQTKVQRIIHHNKLSRAIKPCTTWAASKRKQLYITVFLRNLICRDSLSTGKKLSCSILSKQPLLRSS